MRRLGNHRIRPSLSSYTHGKRRIEEIDRAIARAKSKGDAAAVSKLENEKHWAIVNSLPR